MAALVDRQAHGLLTDEEWAELEKLVATYGRLLHDGHRPLCGPVHARPETALSWQTTDTAVPGVPNAVGVVSLPRKRRPRGARMHRPYGPRGKRGHHALP
jgi:hypothetical protein